MEKVTVADLRELVISDEIAVKDEKGVYRLESGKIVSKATKAELEAAIGANSKAKLEKLDFVTVTETPTLHHKDGPINNAPVVSGPVADKIRKLATDEKGNDIAQQIARCYQKAGEFESKIHIHPRNRRRANYWTKQARKLEKKVA